jgi:2-polyprenyl-6-hydroxyphenyl methylase/3-demethylubiquinone-9 3-methyltransferase
MTARTPSAREYVHEALGPKFADAISRYDLERRLAVLIDEFLPDDLHGQSALDVGCGLGFFSERLVARGARVIGCDLGPGLARATHARAGCETVVADALALADQFGESRFDVVVSSECIEHTPDPLAAIGQMIGVLKPGGYISLSTPNVLWYPAVAGATALGLRPYDGLENFSSWRGLRRAIERQGATVVAERGLHLFPFQLPLHRLSAWCDRRLQVLRGAMINICLLARKRA